jgi:hypothetical protein
MLKIKSLFKKILNPVRQTCIMKNRVWYIETRIGPSVYEKIDLNGYSPKEIERYKIDTKRKAKEYRDKYIAIL